MEPVAVFGSPADELLHRCVLCGTLRKNKVAEGDSFEMLLEVAKKRAEGN